MIESAITSKGQTTLPKAVREALSGSRPVTRCATSYTETKFASER